MLSLEAVTLRSRAAGVAVLDAVDLVLRPGDVAVICGATGTGKSSLVALVTGERVADGGRVRVFDRDLARLRASSLQRLRRRLGVVPQELLLLPDDSALGNVTYALAAQGFPRRELRTLAGHALARVGLAARIDLPIVELSMGERRRVAIARALASDPMLLVADEPTADLDAAGRDELLGLIGELASRGRAALVASNDDALRETARSCGWRVLELAAGRLTDGGADAADTAYDLEILAEIPNVVPFPITARMGARE
jgi:ABC-type ATPase involved in cell division